MSKSMMRERFCSKESLTLWHKARQRTTSLTLDDMSRRPRVAIWIPVGGLLDAWRTSALDRKAPSQTTYFPRQKSWTTDVQLHPWNQTHKTLYPCVTSSSPSLQRELCYEVARKLRNRNTILGQCSSLVTQQILNATKFLRQSACAHDGV